MAHKNVHRVEKPEKKKKKGTMTVCLSVTKDIVTTLWVLIQIIEHFFR